MGERLYEKRGYWYGWYYDRRSRKVGPYSLKTRDKRTAQLKLRRDERAAHGEDHTAADAPPYLTIDAMTHWLEHGLIGKAAGTVDYYQIKSGHLNRLLGHKDVNGLRAEDITEYLKARREEGASQHTISKEMTALRLCLKWAHAQTWPEGMKRMLADPRTLIPEMKSEYIPRKRFLSLAEFEALVASFKRKHRRDWLILAVYTGGRDSEVAGVRWVDIDFLGDGWVTLNGTKTPKARRNIPMHKSLRAALMGMDRRKDGLVVGPWEGVVEDLRKKCLDLGIAKVSPNDLRRTFASWLVQAGVPLKVVAELLGHTSTVMVEKVYGHLVNDNLRDAVNALPKRKPRRVVPG